MLILSKESKNIGKNKIPAGGFNNGAIAKEINMSCLLILFLLNYFYKKH